MKDKKKIIEILVIVVLLIILGIISILIVIKKKELTESEMPKEPISEIYTGSINCLKEIPGENFYKFYLLDVIAVKEEIVESRKCLYKVVYLDKDNYEGFKINEKVKNPEYDDSTLTIIYERDDQIDLSNNHQNYEEFIQRLENNDGYTCNKVI